MTRKSTISTAALGSVNDTLTNFPAAGATSGIGILKGTGSAVLKAEITALESLGMGRTISNPKVFTLDNQKATVEQGTELPYSTTDSEGQSTTGFKKAVLKLDVTPSIIGDGNVLLEISVSNDEPKASTAAVPPISKMQIDTKLL